MNLHFFSWIYPKGHFARLRGNDGKISFINQEPSTFIRILYVHSFIQSLLWRIW